MARILALFSICWALIGCELAADFDRSKIPQPDAGARRDAAAPDAAAQGDAATLPPDAALDGSRAPSSLDAAVPDAAAPDAAAPDAAE